ncbi:MAG: S-layer homology domain-containing protein, partial [Clostridia bacterium]|nr:S-layer homology domain-containing protein [Clostridia bacterium]
MKKRLLSLLLAVCLCFGMTAHAFVVDGIDYPEAGELNVETQVGNGSVLIFWEPPREIEVPIVEHYAYVRNYDTDFEVQCIPNEGEYVAEFTGLENGVEYDVGVVYNYETGYGLEAGAYVIPHTPLTAPVVKGAVIENGKLTISWDQPADLDRIFYYVLEFYGENDSFTLNLYSSMLDDLEYTLDTTEDLQKELYTVYLYAVDYNDIQSDIAVIEIDNREDTESDTPAVWPFTDVDESHPDYEAINFVYSAGLMLGTGDSSTFAPNTNLSRAMVARILHTIVGNPAATPSSFTDVKRNFWYTEAIDWASNYKIISGNGQGQFYPGQDVTREQLAVMLYHFARATGFDVSVGENTNVLSYYDAFDI